MIECINLTCVGATVIVAVVVNDFFVGKLWFFAPLRSHGWYRPWSEGVETRPYL